MYSLADNIWQQGGDNLNTFKRKDTYEVQLRTVAAVGMDSKVYVIHGYIRKRNGPNFEPWVNISALVHCFDPTKNEWKQIASTCHPHFRSSLFVVNNRLYVARGKFLVICGMVTHVVKMYL